MKSDRFLYKSALLSKMEILVAESNENVRILTGNTEIAVSVYM